MQIEQPIPQEKKLTVIFRVEPGCLGPTGGEHIDAFCQFAHPKIATIDADYVSWEVIPRHDKSLDEIQYKLNNKSLSNKQARIYLEKMSKDLDDFEEHLHEQLVELIEEYTQG